MIRQSPHLSAKSHTSAGSDTKSGSQPSKLNLTFADTGVTAPTPEEKKARERVEEGTQRNKKKGPVEGKAGKQDDFVLRPTYDAIGRESISVMAAALREVGKQDMESLAKADEVMLLPLVDVQIFGRCASRQVPEQSSWRGWVTPMVSIWRGKNQWMTGSHRVTRVLYYMFFYGQ